MSRSLARNFNASRNVFVGALAVLSLAACGPRSILGNEPDADGATEDVFSGDAEDTMSDVRDSAMAPDASVEDADASHIDALVEDADASLPDALVGDADADASHPDVMVEDASDVIVDARDVVDVEDARDVVDASDAADAPDVTSSGLGILGSAAEFTILGGSTVTNTGLTTIVGMVGVSPGLALVGIPAGVVVHAGDPVAATAQSDLTSAYNYLAGLPCGTALTGRDLGGMVLPPGVYCFTSSAGLTGTVVLDAEHEPNPLWVFQIGSTLVTMDVSGVTMINGAAACDVFWQVGSSATIGVASAFAGNIVALGSVTLTTGVSLEGRALARTGGVSMDTNSVSNGSCPDPPPPEPIDAGDASVTDASTDAAVDVVDGG